MPLYEHVFLARQDVSQQQVDALTNEYKQVITDAGGNNRSGRILGPQVIGLQNQKKP